MATSLPGMNTGPTKNHMVGANPVPPGFDVQYLTDLKQQADSLHDAILANRCGDWGGYQYAVGQYRSLMVAINTFNDLLEQWRKYQDQY